MPKPQGRTELPFTTGFYQSASRQLSLQNCVNCYVSVAEAKVLSSEALFPCPGIALHDEGELLESNRGGHVMDGAPYFVNGETLYRVTRTVVNEVESFDTEDLGTIEGTARVIMDDNGYQLVIVVPGEKTYLYNANTDALGEIADEDFDGPVESVAFVDGFFFFNKTDTGKIFQSDLNDGTVYDALDFGSAEADPDKIVRLFKFNNELYALGTETITPYQNIGGSGFVMAPVQNGIIDIGIRSKYAIGKFRDSFVFLGAGENIEPAVYLFAGGRPQKISTEPVDSAIQNKTDFEIDGAFFLRYSQNSEDFVLLTVGGTTLGFCYYASQLSGRKVWIERSSRVSGMDFQWRVTSISQAYNRLFVGDVFDGRIGLLDDELGTEYDEPIIREFTTQPFYNQGVSVSVAALELVMEGAGDDEGYIELTYSDDGRTWSQGLLKKIGETGQYGLRKIWRRLGRFPALRTFRFTTSSSVPPYFNKLLANLKGGQ